MENNLEENCELWGQNLAINEYNSKETQLFSIYRKLVLLLSLGITFRDILLNMNIHKVNIRKKRADRCINPSAATDLLLLV